MEFLLKSYRKNRNWVWLKQLLLLLSRIAILLMALFLLSQVGCENDRVAALLGGRATHHYVILDDSFSMSDRGNQAAAIDRAKSTVTQIVSRARSRSNHRFSLLRYSAFDAVGDSETLVPRFDIENELVDSTFARRVESVVTGIEPSAFSMSAKRALEAVVGLVRSRNKENSIVYLLTDFREKDWQEPGFDGSFKAIDKAGAAVELIRCAKTRHSNLAITELKPVGNVRVAETPLMMEVTVTNFGQEVAKKIQIGVGSTVYDRPSAGSSESVSTVDELPTVFVESIEAGESETRRFPVWFGQPGRQSVSVSIAEDAVSLDNVRHCVVDVKPEVRVLLIDQSNRTHADFLALALNPNDLTGIRPEIQMVDFLRNADLEMLARFDMVCLCDPGQVDEAGIRNLREYVSAGGGLAYFGGPNTNFAFFNHNFYEDGEGLMPVELADVQEIDEREDGMAPDVVPEKHPIFAPVLDVRNSLLDIVQVKKVLRPSFGWLQNQPATAKVIATVRGNRQMPLLVEGQYGNGRTLMCMTTAGTQWNNWMRNATFPPVLLLLEEYLAAGKYPHEVTLVGTPVDFVKPTGSVTPDVTLWSPTMSDERIERKIRLTQSDAGLAGRVGESSLSNVNRGSAVPGVYELWFRQMDSSSSVDRVALNVDCEESDLALLDDEDVILQLGGVEPKLTDWDQFNPEPEQKAVSSLNRLLLLLLVGLLIVEQYLGWACSYH
jgi:hypothetical protein